MNNNQIINLKDKKVCSMCKDEKYITEFCKNKRTKDGFHYRCKNCCSQWKKQWHFKNPDKVRKSHEQYAKKNPEKIKERNRCRHLKNKDRDNQRNKQQRDENPGYMKLWRKNNPDKVKASRQKYTKTIRSTVTGHLNHKMGSSIRKALGSNKAGRHWEALVGYTLEQLQSSLESKFTYLMDWERMGEWDIDHYFCKSRLIFDNAEDPTFKFLWSLENLQPLWHLDNMLKGDMTPWEWEAFKKANHEKLYKPKPKPHQIIEQNNNLVIKYTDNIEQKIKQIL